jgi:pyruvate-formate lyase-activating enzyme
MKIRRVRIRGWGEATLHPEFVKFVKKLGQAARYVDVVSNGHWHRSEISESLIGAPVARIDVSVQAGGTKSNFENRGGDLELIKRNLVELRDIRDRTGKKKPIIVVRLMFRPSQTAMVKDEIRQWHLYSDSVIPAPIYREARSKADLDYGDDVFILLKKILLLALCRLERCTSWPPARFLFVKI